MTSPAQIKESTLAALRGTRQDMSTAKWLRAVGKKPMEIQREEALKRLDVEQAILALGNERLADIGASLQENESALVEGEQALIAARKKLDHVESVLGAVGNLLNIVSKVVRLPVGR